MVLLYKCKADTRNKEKTKGLTEKEMTTMDTTTTTTTGDETVTVTVVGAGELREQVVAKLRGARELIGQLEMTLEDEGGPDSCKRLRELVMVGVALSQALKRLAL